MTVLSVNLNKLALLRNSRGRNYPDLIDFSRRFIERGVKGLTIHPRPDERHIKRSDARALAQLLQVYPHIELNIEGYPSPEFMALVEQTQPAQCTLVPDADNQLTSDHGWDCIKQAPMLSDILQQLKEMNIRSAIFLDPDLAQAEAVCKLAPDRIELYTESYAEAFGSPEQSEVLLRYSKTAKVVQDQGIGVNAGHDLDLANLPLFLTIEGILEVSIGHALTVECIEQGMDKVISNYLRICAGAH